MTFLIAFPNSNLSIQNPFDSNRVDVIGRRFLMYRMWLAATRRVPPFLKALTLLCFGLVEVPVAQATRKARNHQIRLIMMKSVHVLLVKRKFVEKCVKQTSGKVLENPANYPSALLSCNWAGKPWSIGDILNSRTSSWKRYFQECFLDKVFL